MAANFAQITEHWSFAEQAGTREQGENERKEGRVNQMWEKEGARGGKRR